MSPAFIAAEMALFAEQASSVDIIITTALIPGKPSPTLITEQMVSSMRPGSVIVDLAAEAGGNCALTRPGEVVQYNGVTIIGYMDLPSRLAPMASQLYGSNITHLLTDMGGAKNWRIDLDDAVVRAAIILHEGKPMWPAPRPASPPAVALTAAASAAPLLSKPVPAPRRAVWTVLALVLGSGLLFALGAVAPPAFVSHLTVFVLACFVGWQVVWNVTAALHTPLMSVTNAISGIIILGGMLQLGGELSDPVTLIGAAAVLLASINVAGGFLVTQRMLRMFRR
jgi:NAD(P) transhydrogenase subunit alpha